MKSNYNDVIDIILTFATDEELSRNIAISGSIIPYLALNKESNEFHKDLYILVKDKKSDYIRRKVKKLSREYEFDFISDSKDYSNEDYGFKIKYQDTTVGFFPYSLINDNFTIKTYSINEEEYKINLEKKVIPDIKKSSIIRLIPFAKEKIRIMSPEFVLTEKEMSEDIDYENLDKSIVLLKRICDESVLKYLRNSVINTKVKIITKDTKENNKVLVAILVVLVILLILVAYICFKK